MNIYALKGHKVKCKTLNAGYDHDQIIAKKYLSLNNTYTIEETIVHGWSTEVYLKEFPGIQFNSVFFEDVIEQPQKDNTKHEDYSKYH